jgi:hypothetical protein
MSTSSKHPHGQKGHVNAYTLDEQSHITGHGRHARVIAFMPDHEGLYCRVDMTPNLREPTIDEIMTVARKDADVKGRWTLKTVCRYHSNGLERLDYNFTRKSLSPN